MTPERDDQGAGDAGALVGHLFRREAGRLVSGLVRVFGPARIDLAEDVVQEALLRALREWPFRGVPDHPRAWLARVARNLALDRLRREANLARKLEETGAPAPEPPPERVFFSDEVKDDRLRMLFTCCHPAVPHAARVALTLKTVCGFGVPEIARAFLAGEAAVAQRLVRAKRALREADARFEVPGPAELPARLDAVLETVYLLFTEGHAATRGDAVLRADVCEDAVRLALLLARHPVAGTPRAHALAALVLLHGARIPARLDETGTPLPLEEQDRSRWDGRMIGLGMRHLERAAVGDDLSPYHLEAGIAAAHAAAPSWEATDWPGILRLYERLREARPGPAVEVGRAVALAMVRGPDAGLAALDAASAGRGAAEYPPLLAARARLLEMRGDGAAEAWRRAAARAGTGPERRWMEARAERDRRP